MKLPRGRTAGANCSSEPGPIQRRLQGLRSVHAEFSGGNAFRRNALRITLLRERNIKFSLQACLELRDQERIAARLSRQAAPLRRRSSSLCAAETKSASNCEGGKRILRRTISWKKDAKRRVSDVFAPA